MNLIRLPAILLLTVCLLALSSSASAMTFTTSNLDDAGTWNTVYVQGFRPSLDASPDPGLSAGDSVSLEQFNFYKSGTADSAADIRLAILNTIWYDWNTPLTAGSWALEGISTNTIASTASLVEGDAISFSFDSLPLTYGSDYAAVFVTNDGSGNLTPVLVSALTENWAETEEGSGVWLPVSGYGTSTEYQYSTSNYINGGYFQAFDESDDAKFEATFTAVPEPGTGLLMVCAFGFVFMRKR